LYEDIATSFPEGGERQEMTPAEKVFPAQKVEEFCVDVLTKAGLSPDWSAIVAESLLCAEVRGILSHGVVRLESYIQRVEAGVMKIQSPIATEMDAQVVALLNANNTFGQIAGHKAMSLAIEKAKQYGTGVVAVKNSNHFGVAAYYAMMALQANMVGCVFTNSSPAMAVYGTKTPLIGTNPIAIAIPAGDHFPIVLDMSTSVVARGKIRYAALTGHSIPLGWARDIDGKPTEDAKVALKGSLEPVGGVKGSALSLIIDIVCGILTNTVLTGGVKNITDVSGPAKTGHFFAALDISRFIDMKLFKSNVDQVITNIKSLPAVDGGQIFMPGEIEFHLSKKRMEEGIPLEEEVVRSLNAVAARYGVSPLISFI
jgi:LDH2 family malate/lactate/ureidoglycolate dehydrogenase